MDPNLKIRLERAESWIEVASAIPSSKRTEISDAAIFSVREHERFMFYWIAFNCLYGTHISLSQDNLEKGKSSEIEAFLEKVAKMFKWDLEGSTLIGQTLMNDQETRRLGKQLIRDYFLDKRYWEPRLHINDVKRKCEEEWTKAEDSLTKKCYQPFLMYSLDRLKVLRNQIMHGSVTYGRKSKGWESLETGVLLLSRIVPAFVELLSRYGNRLNWEPAPYPRLGHPGHPRHTTIRTK